MVDNKSDIMKMYGKFQKLANEIVKTGRTSRATYAIISPEWAEILYCKYLQTNREVPELTVDEFWDEMKNSLDFSNKMIDNIAYD